MGRQMRDSIFLTLLFLTWIHGTLQEIPHQGSLLSGLKWKQWLHPQWMFTGITKPPCSSAQLTAPSHKKAKVRTTGVLRCWA